jgi:hypothetical protein
MGEFLDAAYHAAQTKIIITDLEVREDPAKVSDAFLRTVVANTILVESGKELGGFKDMQQVGCEALVTHGESHPIQAYTPTKLLVLDSQGVSTYEKIDAQTVRFINDVPYVLPVSCGTTVKQEGHLVRITGVITYGDELPANQLVSVRLLDLLELVLHTQPSGDSSALCDIPAEATP